MLRRFIAIIATVAALNLAVYPSGAFAAGPGHGGHGGGHGGGGHWGGHGGGHWGGGGGWGGGWDYGGWDVNEALIAGAVIGSIIASSAYYHHHHCWRHHGRRVCR